MLGSWLPSLMLSRAQAKLCPGPLDLLVSVPKLVHPRPHAPISHVKDASDTHLGAVLQQLLDGSWASLMFYCKKLSDAEKKYSTLDSELLAAYSSLCHFRFMLEATVFTIFTDHKLLTHALFRVSPTKSPRQQRHLFYLAIDYTYGQL